MISLDVSNRGRHEKIGGTDIGIITRVKGCFKNIETLYMEKALGQETFSGNKYTRWGQRAEPIIADEFSERHGICLIETPPIQHPELEWAVGSADRIMMADMDDYEEDTYDLIPQMGLMVKDIGLEIKTCGSKSEGKWGDDGLVVESMDQDIVPQTYAAQCQWYMACTGFRSWMLVVKIDSADYREFEVLRDNEYIEFAEKQGAKFMEAVKARTGIEMGDFPRAKDALDWI